MIPNVNLLPQAYQQAQFRRYRFRIGLIMAVALLGAELFAGLILHARAGQTRELFAAARVAEADTRKIQEKLKDPARQAAQYEQKLILARRLRSTHYWSRLLGLLAQAAPARVTLTATATDPPRWSTHLGSGEPPDQNEKSKTALPPMLQGMVLRGYAADHSDLSRFIRNLHASSAFASIHLKEARRDRYMENEAIAFELQCRW
ncbi:MAG: hypothetical protein AMXMBFR13_01300 [Phycisphaerae bacterium]|jgi:Tfp pilus assembly protein PilN